jgi:hypothetical protein
MAVSRRDGMQLARQQAWRKQGEIWRPWFVYGPLFLRAIMFAAPPVALYLTWRTVSHLWIAVGFGALGVALMVVLVARGVSGSALRSRASGRSQSAIHAAWVACLILLAGAVAAVAWK